MIMMAFTNSKSLATVWGTSAAKTRPAQKEPSICSQVIAMLDKGISDKVIKAKFKLRKMQLAGYKRVRTIRKNLQKRVDSKRKM